jgi:hypothetical protein
MRGLAAEPLTLQPDKRCTIDGTTVFLPKMSATNGFGNEIRLRTGN